MAVQIIQELSRLSALVLHPEDNQAHEIVKQLERIGCRSVIQWPIPNKIEEKYDVVVLCIGDNHPSLSLPQFFDEAAKPTIIAIIDYENPTMLEIACDFGVHSIITSPFKPFGLLSTLVIARKQWHQELYFNRRINKLEKKVNDFRYIEKAVSIIEQSNSIDRDKAYEFIRKQAMNRRLTTEDVAKEIIHAHETLSVRP